MQFLLRFILITVKLTVLLLQTLEHGISHWRKRNPARSELPAISNRLVTLRLGELRQQLCNRQLTSVEVIEAYIERIKNVNPHLNAVVETRFEAALEEAAATDMLIASTKDLDALFEEKPLLGLPVTVKESCALSDMPFAVGSMARSQLKAEDDGVVVARVRAAGAIPLLVSATPEYCYASDTETLLNGRCLNPYDITCTSGGSSGGEAALNGAGASLFGIGSDIGGSIRIPSLYCGIFGHKPTGGVVTNEGHFPNSQDADTKKYLVLGPMTRFATDLNQLLEIMAGDKAEQLRLREPIQLDQVKVHYALGFTGINGHMHIPVDQSIQDAILKAVTHLKTVGLSVEAFQMPVEGNDSLEISLCCLAQLTNLPFVLKGEDKLWDTMSQILRSLCGQSEFTVNALVFDMMRRSNAFVPLKHSGFYNKCSEALLEKFTELLGESGVLLFPTMHTPALKHGWTTLHLFGIDYTTLFNILGLPVTHVPLGLNAQGLPVGLSVIAGPYQDRLCLLVAVELEKTFGGWQSPVEHQFVN